ncbi:GNAT family N-acetyltransferase [Asanoa sp. WMMD1127]|uniref:GNAT family N-acetyltransferase n=1 Tax=Asanoa sp. WMMD1127 TaxID=3016107 RepID=UPI0024166882|nr:GNAT family N-acetyltransferase [Asanoa sp. WMMD1127]MDG4823667.1 GNAT family N-acetyltransferase [Asanoa sp. WMMD1127]
MVSIRSETLADIPEIAALHVRAWQVGYAGIIPAEVLDALDAGQRAAKRREWHGATQFHTLVATDGPDDAIVGFATVGPYRHQQDRTNVDPTIGELLAIYLDPERVGTGVGRALLAAALDDLRESGYDEVRLWVLDANTRARRFYEAAGFRPDGERAAYAVNLRSGGDPVLLPELRYARRLD